MTLRNIMDEFTMFLVIGLIFIVLAFVFLGPWSHFEITTINTSQENHTETTTTLPIITVNKEGKLVGPQKVDVWRSFDLGKINVSYGSYEHVTGIEQKKIYNGVLFGSSKIEMNVDIDKENLLGGYVQFKVDDTNGYGPLIIKFNDLVLNKSRFAPGVYKIMIDKGMIEKSNKLEIEAGSSSWKIWAPTVYDLSGVKFVYLTHYSVPNTIKFTLYPDEYHNLEGKTGRLVLDLSEHKGTLNIDLNGKNIFRNETKTYQVISFNESMLLPGENEIQLYSEGNSLIQGDVRLIIYYTTERENQFEKTFFVSSDDFEKLNTTHGTIEFNVTSVINDGGMAVEIEDSDGNLHTVGYELTTPGMHVLYFNSTQCTEEYNKLLIKSVDSGTFWINDVSINI